MLSAPSVICGGPRPSRGSPFIASRWIQIISLLIGSCWEVLIGPTQGHISVQWFCSSVSDWQLPCANPMLHDVAPPAAAPSCCPFSAPPRWSLITKWKTQTEHIPSPNNSAKQQPTTVPFSLIHPQHAHAQKLQPPPDSKGHFDTLVQMGTFMAKQAAGT